MKIFKAVIENLSALALVAGAALWLLFSVTYAYKRAWPCCGCWFIGVRSTFRNCYGRDIVGAADFLY